ncbi:MAG: sigma-70 family RNA polymerase sigma factor [Actinobacteria bacterium]|nr:sigma-70 family RNA polymerase sigma factor [Actinomycetota bacterium]
MALSEEQNAMLRLLAQGEQGYADIAALMGLSEEEVRAKVVGALAQLQAEGKPTPDVPPPLPGGAKPAAEVTPPEPAAGKPERVAAEPEPAAAKPERVAAEPKPAAGKPERVAAKPERVAGEPELSTGAGPAVADADADAPKEPASAATQPPVAPTPPPASPSTPHPAGGRTITLPTGQRAWLLGGGIVAIVAAIVVVILLVSDSGDGGSSSPSNNGATTAAETAKGEGSAGGKPATEAKLKAVDGSEAKGFASFGRVKNKLALQVEATGLEPTEEGVNSYAIWLAQSPQKMIPLASTGVKASGEGAGIIAAQFEVPVQILGYLAGGTFDQIAITKVDNKRFRNSVTIATKQKKTPTYLGKEVLRGTITGPIVGLAVREEEEKKAEEGK